MGGVHQFESFASVYSQIDLASYFCIFVPMSTEGVIMMGNVQSLCFRMIALTGFSITAKAAVELPSYAQGPDIKQTLSSKGQQVTELFLFAGGIAAILAILYGSFALKMGNRENAKKFIWGGVIGLLIDVLVYPIVQLIAK